MLKTDRPVFIQCKPAWMLFLLMFLVFGLLVHFLIEDLSLFSNQNVNNLSDSNLIEITHQDDLVQSNEIPTQNSVFLVEPVLLGILITQIQVFFPKFNPPKLY